MTAHIGTQVHECVEFLLRLLEQTEHVSNHLHSQKRRELRSGNHSGSTSPLAVWVLSIMRQSAVYRFPFKAVEYDWGHHDVCFKIECMNACFQCGWYHALTTSVSLHVK